MDDGVPVLVLGVHPWSRGYGWVLLESRCDVFDWGTVDARKDKNATALRRFETLLDRYEPAILALESFDEGSRRGTRIRILCRALVRRAQTRALQVEIFTREEIRRMLGSAAPVTRHETAATIARHFAALAPSLPPPRKIWNGEHSNMAMFSAAACALASYARQSAIKSALRG